MCFRRGSRYFSTGTPGFFLAEIGVSPYQSFMSFFLKKIGVLSTRTPCLSSWRSRCFLHKTFISLPGDKSVLLHKNFMFLPVEHLCFSTRTSCLYVLKRIASYLHNNFRSSSSKNSVLLNKNFIFFTSDSRCFSTWNLRFSHGRNRMSLSHETSYYLPQEVGVPP